ncbi:MAG: sigma-54-dependent Fis family transcriptional regulator [Candidatus Hydrogenedentes bacterium]|nr:sigma-54-dependent Fis family transcriptional regulator [Candidatus Hydrogenedentota bacterium]
MAYAQVAYADTLARFLESGGYAAERCHDAKGLFRILTRKPFDVVVLDLDLGDDTDIDLISFTRRRQPDAQLILLFEMAKIDRAIEGIRAGAYFYLPKTCQPSDVALVVGKALHKTVSDSSLSRFEQNLLEETMGTSPSMRRVIELVRKVAPTNSTVLLLGESGTGKEVLAHAIHRSSTRRERPFVAVNCAALPETLLESELFGHLKGAFTGAEANKRGLFEEADGGTIFLDEIGDMAPLTQAKVLRVLQDGEIRPVGAAVTKHVDVRVLAATNRDLVEAVHSFKFREDLYFRLNVIQIRIPPLRERLESLPGLVSHFLARYNASFGKRIRGFDEQSQILLRNYGYPGNIRELESIVAHAVIMADGDTIAARDLPDDVRQGVRPRFALPNYVADSIPSLENVEAQSIRATLEKLDWNQTTAAKKLGISRSTLWRKLRQYEITPPADSEEQA